MFTIHKSKHHKKIPNISYSKAGMTVSQHSLVGLFLRISYALFMQEKSDEQLMYQYAKGDANAFDQLYSSLLTQLSKDSPHASA